MMLMTRMKDDDVDAGKIFLMILMTTMGMMINSHRKNDGSDGSNGSGDDDDDDDDDGDYTDGGKDPDGR